MMLAHVSMRSRAIMNMNKQDRERNRARVDGCAWAALVAAHEDVPLPILVVNFHYRAATHIQCSSPGSDDDSPGLREVEVAIAQEGAHAGGGASVEFGTEGGADLFLGGGRRLGGGEPGFERLRSILGAVPDDLRAGLCEQGRQRFER
jgi:hypothetical protein